MFRLGALAAIPPLVPLGLAWAGMLAWPPALAAAAACAAATAGLLLLAHRDRARRAHAALSLSRTLEAHQAELHDMVQAEQAVLQRLPHPVLLLGADRAVTRANAAAEVLLGPGLGAIMRQPGLRAAIDRALADGRTHEAELTLPVPTPRELHATVMNLPPGRADGSRILAVLADRTRERAVERMRADFVANASHELRTPLASLIGFIDTLRGPAADDPPAQARFLGIMAEQAQRMNRLIDDLLSLSRIEMNEHQPPSGLLAPGAIVRRVAATFEPQLAPRHVALVLNLAEPLPDIPGDADQLEQVLHNLVDNAIKYGREHGTVRLDAAPEARQGRNGVVLRVTDDGPGIARTHIPRLTERFYRADKHRSRAVGGTGLGLAIVKHIVTRHRGQLGIESAEGAGTTVTIWLPASAPGAGVAGAP